MKWSGSGHPARPTELRIWVAAETSGRGLAQEGHDCMPGGSLRVVQPAARDAPLTPGRESEAQCGSGHQDVLHGAWRWDDLASPGPAV